MKVSCQYPIEKETEKAKETENSEMSEVRPEDISIPEKDYTLYCRNLRLVCFFDRDLLYAKRSRYACGIVYANRLCLRFGF